MPLPQLHVLFRILCRCLSQETVPAFVKKRLKIRKTNQSGQLPSTHDAKIWTLSATARLGLKWEGEKSLGKKYLCLIKGYRNESMKQLVWCLTRGCRSQVTLSTQLLFKYKFCSILRGLLRMWCRYVSLQTINMNLHKALKIYLFWHKYLTSPHFRY
jgi:hypothetical protein